jgi:hypothetical protein
MQNAECQLADKMYTDLPVPDIGVGGKPVDRSYAVGIKNIVDLLNASQKNYDNLVAQYPTAVGVNPPDVVQNAKIDLGSVKDDYDRYQIVKAKCGK